MPRAKKNTSNQVGNALIKGMRKQENAHRKADHQYFAETTASSGSIALQEKSTTELGNLEEFLAEAELAGREFEAERETTVLVANSNGHLVKLGEETSNLRHVISDFNNNEPANLTEEERLILTKMPRRPKWIPNQTTSEELDKMEKISFLEWRKSVAEAERVLERRGMIPTPFEKNLNFWRQLWRVVERSDVLVQVVDARNPFIFRFPDLEVYVKECSEHKTNLLLINKADLLSPEERGKYSEYFHKMGINFIFFSAKLTQSAINEGKKEESQDFVATREELLVRLTEEAKKAALVGKKDHNGIVGMVGYPNVGKSSVINALIGASIVDHLAQRVSVSATPGHTKHFQTLNIGEMTLCDCPGLVFPSFIASKAEMLCNGVLPIDEMRGRDFVPAIDLICKRVKRSVLEEFYKFKIEMPSSYEFASWDKMLESFCKSKGLYAQGHGRYDEPKAARLILKDFVAGRICYCHPPPGEDDAGEEEPGEEQVLDDVLFDAGKEEEKLEKTKGLSRSLANHGRKHRKARDKDPYSHENAAFVAKAKTKKSLSNTEDFTRKTGFST